MLVMLGLTADELGRKWRAWRELRRDFQLGKSEY